MRKHVVSSEESWVEEFHVCLHSLLWLHVTTCVYVAPVTSCLGAESTFGIGTALSEGVE